MKEEEDKKTHYYIYCEKHTPLKLRRLYEQKEKKTKEEIFRFFKTLNKYQEALDREDQKKRLLNKQSPNGKKISHNNID